MEHLLLVWSVHRMGPCLAHVLRIPINICQRAVPVLFFECATGPQAWRGAEDLCITIPMELVPGREENTNLSSKDESPFHGSGMTLN